MPGNPFMLHNVDARKIHEILKSQIIDVTITSPPYYNLKDYGYKEQIGFGQSYSEYLDDLKLVFENVYNATKETGTLWVVIDTFRKDNEIIPLPFDFSNKIKEIGWKLQDIIIWNKDRTVPWSDKGHTKSKFEYILLFSKSSTYKYYKDNGREYDTKILKKWWIRYPERYNPRGKAPDEIWNYDIPIQGSWGNKYIRHFCPLPTDMIGRMILLTSDEGDVILDPFAGSGSVLTQAAYMNRKYIGFELNKSYIEMFTSYLENSFSNGQKNYHLVKSGKYTQENFSETILNLRALKFAKILRRKISESLRSAIKLIYVERTGSDPKEEYKVITVKYNIYLDLKKYSDKKDKALETLEQEIKEVIKCPPLSKFGIEPQFNISYNDYQLPANTPLYVYTDTITHKYKEIFEPTKKIRTFEIVSPIKLEINESHFE